ncbi:22221_t:CDS:2, partial [Racocetra persica]
NLDDDMLSEKNSDDDTLSEENFDNDNLSKENLNDDILSEENSEDDVSREGDSVFGKDSSDGEIVDKSLNAEKMLSNNGEFTPYFKNITKYLKSNWFVFEKPKNIENDTNEESILLNLNVQLELFYEDLEYSYPAWNNSLLFFEYASFLIEESGTSIQCYLHVEDVVLINSDKEEESFSIIYSIFCDQKDEHNTTFIIINWLENTNQTKLDCLVYRLHTTNK